MAASSCSTSTPTSPATLTTRSRIEQQLRRLTQKARAAGIHVIVATQRPSADVVSTTIRSNFPAQLALRVKTATDSRIIMDESGAEALAGQGDAFLRTARVAPPGCRSRGQGPSADWTNDRCYTLSGQFRVLMLPDFDDVRGSHSPQADTEYSRPEGG